MLAAKVALLAAQACDRDRTLPFQESDHRCYRVFRWNRDAHVYMVGHEVSLQDLALLLSSQRVEDRPQLPRVWPKMAFRRLLGTNTTWYLQSHFEWVRL